MNSFENPVFKKLEKLRAVWDTFRMNPACSLVATTPPVLVRIWEKTICWKNWKSNFFEGFFADFKAPNLQKKFQALWMNNENFLYFLRSKIKFKNF